MSNVYAHISHNLDWYLHKAYLPLLSNYFILVLYALCYLFHTSVLLHNFCFSITNWKQNKNTNIPEWEQKQRKTKSKTSLKKSSHQISWRSDENVLIDFVFLYYFHVFSIILSNLMAGDKGKNGKKITKSKKMKKKKTLLIFVLKHFGGICFGTCLNIGHVARTWLLV